MVRIQRLPILSDWGARQSLFDLGERTRFPCRQHFVGIQGRITKSRHILLKAPNNEGLGETNNCYQAFVFSRRHTIDTVLTIDRLCAAAQSFGKIPTLNPIVTEDCKGRTRTDFQIQRHCPRKTV